MLADGCRRKACQIRSLCVADKRGKRTYNHAMRIGIDCRLPTYRMGGISQYVLHLMPALAELDRQNQYFVFHSRKESRSFFPQGAPNWERRNLWTPCHHRAERWSLAVELAPYGLDVLHSPDFIPPLYGGDRKVITIHDLNFLYYPQLLTKESKRHYLDQIQWAVAEADVISADSFATGRDIVTMLDVRPQKVQVVHLAASPLYSQRVERNSVDEALRRYGLPAGFLLFVGTVEPRKNLPMLLRVYGRLRSEKKIQIPLVLVGGKGWLYEDVFVTMQDLNLEPYVRHLEAIPDDDLLHLYHGAGVLLTPSLYEGFGLPALEAQHCGCPAVVSDRGSLPEIVGDGGLAIDPDDEDLWVKTITRVLKDREYRDGAIAYGREQATNFHWSKTARKTLALYLDQTDPRVSHMVPGTEAGVN